ncbi:MAG: 4Fe-4S dicluster domain-containing protein [Clostridia bacterium]|nr:4Fe-4S dicluster domain-containing protein [Clostridia bacterium]MBQ5813271.1 4Fe-4S dicluster domain-containing protein [Clostridia bacterium]
MKPTKVTLVYFSATNTGKKGLKAIAQAMGCPVSEIDITAHTFASTTEAFGADELVIFGAPCYGGRIPKVAAERLGTFKGNNTPCVAVITYGNRHYDDSVVEMCDMAKQNGFVPVAAAALIGQHTFGQIAVGRPNEDDLKEDAGFGAKILASLENGISDITDKVPGNRPYKDGGSGGKFRPSTLDKCVSCGLCAKMCSTGAIGPDFRTIDDTKCISCFRCIAVCPMKAKAMVNPAYDEFCVGFNEKLSARRENEYFI